MATTAQQIFDMAMGLMDELDGSTGSSDTWSTAEYRHRCLYILNALRGELYPYSDTYSQDEPGKRPVCPLIADFSSPIPLDDSLAQTVLPYGLAAALLMEENPDSASFMQQRYEELRESIKKQSPGGFESIDNLYAGTEHNQFSRW